MQVNNSSLPYSERKLQQTASHVSRGVADVADVFVTGLNFMQPHSTGLMWLDIGMGVGHALYGISRVAVAMDEDKTPYEAQRCRTQAFGECLQVAGYVGLAAGMGPWALPIVALGAAVSNFAYFQ